MRKDIFGDERRIPRLKINVKVKIKAASKEENTEWNRVFGYIMKKPRTKLEFLTVNLLRDLDLNKIELKHIAEYLISDDYNQLKKIEKTFNAHLTIDVKAFILSVLKIPFEQIKRLTVI